MPKEEYERILSMPIKDEGYGFDPFGLEKESTMIAYLVFRYIYKHWFCVESQGHQHIPTEGRALIASNHSGVIPLDASMIAIDVTYKLAKPRIVRSMVDNFMGFLPFLNVFFYRVGQVVGARRNFEDLLKNDELVSVFPEGTKGLGKPYSRKYRLARFNLGFIELALLHKAPIIPCAVVGAEEQAPMLANLKSVARLLNIPYFPVTPFFPLLGPAGMLPLPAQYYIRYGEPLHFYEEYGPEVVEDPEIVRSLAEKVQMIVQNMINDMLKNRDSIFTIGKKRRAIHRNRKRRME